VIRGNSIAESLSASLRATLLGATERVLRSEGGRELVLEVAQPLTVNSPRCLALPLADCPYDDVARPAERGATSLRDDVILISARFRSGSTLLWNLFRHIAGITAYYEPFNERRWFDSTHRGDKIDKTHRYVSDYWSEYEGLTELAEYYDDEWIRRDLYMDETVWAPRMKRYVELLIERAEGRPVLQFNRIDFRLPWFRANFPNAKLVHLYRHPREQWLSSLDDPEECGPDLTMERFAERDHYYLLMWANDLRTHFPFLTPKELGHPYELFYLMWRLSYMFGRRFTHYSIQFERIVTDAITELRSLFEAVNLPGVDIKRLQSVLAPPPLERWKGYADADWFLKLEERCERTLADFFPANDSTAPALTT
jgi:Sulfotransferase family